MHKSLGVGVRLWLNRQRLLRNCNCMSVNQQVQLLLPSGTALLLRQSCWPSLVTYLR